MIKNFTFHNPTKIIFGKEAINALKNEVPPNTRLMLVYGGGSIKKNGVYDKIKKALDSRLLFEFANIQPNPAYETLIECIKEVRDKKIDFLIAAGGGSVIDGTKFIAAGAKYNGNPWDIVQTRGSAIKQALPFATVLTLPATGSEMNSTSVITHQKNKAKLSFKNHLVYPVFSILDPQNSFSLPATQISNGVIDAFTHVLEQYLTWPVDAKLHDRFAEGILLTLIEEGPKALKEPQNYDCRANIMWCATMALNGLIGAGVPQDWATHIIGHELTMLYSLDHAVTLAIVLPALLEEKKEEKKEKLLQYAHRVWNINTGTQNEIIDSAIKQTRKFFESLNVKTRLSDYNLSADSIDKVIAQLNSHQMTKLGEHKNIGLEEANKILLRAL